MLLLRVVMYKLLVLLLEVKLKALLLLLVVQLAIVFGSDDLEATPNLIILANIIRDYTIQSLRK